MSNIATNDETVDLTTQDAAPVPEGPGRFRVLAVPFTGYLLYFVGIGQIAGGVVHYPMDPNYYTLMAGLGVLVFLAGTWLNEVVLPTTRPSARQITRLVCASVVLSMGIGGVSGGAQHFLQFPQRSLILIGVGLVVAFVGFIWKGSFSTRQSVTVGASVVAIAAITLFALQPLAASLEHSGGGHVHGSSANPLDDVK